MIHYVFLSLFTLLIIFLSWKIWAKTGQVAFLIGIFFLYYWSLLGAWVIIFDSLTGQKGADFGLHYYHFNKYLFPLYVDKIYLWVISLYAAFILVVQLTILYFAAPRSRIPASEVKPVEINHPLLIVICVLSSVISFFLVWKEILTAAKFGESIYVVTRHQPGRFVTIHQLLNEVSVIALYIGLISCISGKNSKYISGDNRKKILVFYVLAVIFIEFYLLLLGNKKEIFFGGILALIFYFNNVVAKANWKAVALFLFIIILPLFFNDGFRAYSPTFLTKYFDVSGLELHLDREIAYTQFTVKNTALSFLFSNEMFSAHYSMYGVLSHDVPLTYGSSLLSLAASFIPRIAWPGRPGTVYEYYVQQVGATPGQGYTIHHASGWYLNFGIAGVLAGAFVFGLLWVYLYNKFNAVSGVRNNFLKIFFILGISAITAHLPSLIRTSPEGYKALFFEALLLPAAIIYIAKLGNKNKQ